MALDTDPDDLRAHAARIESIRAAMNPGALPVGFAPAGGDPASVLAANSISSQAAATVNALWSVWRDLGDIAGKLRPIADGYQSQDDVSQANLSNVEVGTGPSGGAVSPQVPTPEVAPVAVPVVYTSTPPATPEELSAAIHSGPGASSPETFAQTWSTHAGAVESAAADLQSLKGSLGSSWAGTAHDGADRTVGAVHTALVNHTGSVTKVSNWANTHAADFRTAVDPASGVPQPAQFAAWDQNLNNAVAAEAQNPGVYTAAVLQAQNDLNQGYTQAGTAYGQYAIDPVTGQAIDPLTGLPVDPVTGEPLGDDVADAAAEQGDPEQMLSTGGQLLTGLLGGAVGAAGAAIGAAVQGGQQFAQMATSGVSQLAKSVSQASAPEVGGGDLSGGDFGGGAGDFGGGGGGGATEPASAPMGPAVGTASAPPTASPATPAGPSVRGPGEGPANRGLGMGGMGMPYMPMGGGMAPGGAGAGDGKSEASPNGKKLVAPSRANTGRVIGEIESERMTAKGESRKHKAEEAKEARRRELLAQSNTKSEQE